MLPSRYAHSKPDGHDTALTKNFDLVYFAVRGLVRNLFFRPFGGIREIHGERMPMSGPLIVAANHFSLVDPPLVACSTLRRIRFMAKAELFDYKILGPLIRRLGAFPVHRGEADMEAIRTTLDLLSQGEAVLVFPEGGRGDGRVLHAANKGVTLLARKSGAPVLPVGLVDTDKLIRYGSRIPKRTLVKVNFGEPFTYASLEEEHGAAAKERFGEILMAKIAALMAEAGREIEVSTEPISR